MILTLVSFFVVLSIMVFVHELGHFLAAKRAGVRVEEFGFGYPPRLFTIGRRGETLYTINAIPFGGFVRLAGEDNPNVPDGLANQPKRVRAAILAAGPLMNFVLAVLCFILAFGLGWASGDGIRVTGVIENTPAVAAGFQSGDVIIAVDGIPVQTTTQFVDYIGARAGQPVRVTVRRNHDTMDLYVTPEFNAEAGRAQIGLYLGPKLTWGEAILEGFIQTGQVIYLTLSVPILLLRGIIPLEAARPIGPVGIAQLASGAVRQSIAMDWWFPILQLMGVLSAAIGITNLLPLPALDGGRILFVIVEAIRGKRIPPEQEGRIHFIGFMLLISLLVIITYIDIVNPLPSVDWSNML
jgi:regulator of sigma E protease